jgi:hypothetical protein
VRETETAANSDAIAKLQGELLKEYVRRGSAGKHKWPWEQERWHELVFCLLARVAHSPEVVPAARETAEIFASLNLLEIESLARVMGSNGEVDFSKRETVLMLEILKRQGFNDEQARAAVTTICEAALAAHRRFGGKIQRYLRKYGELMLDELSQNFAFSRMSKEDMRLAFTHWLQNVLNMPVPVSHPAVKTLCDEYGITIGQLTELADREDLNVALMDELAWACVGTSKQAAPVTTE